MVSCDDGEANVNGTSALPALACDDVTSVDWWTRRTGPTP